VFDLRETIAPERVFHSRPFPAGANGTGIGNRGTLSNRDYVSLGDLVVDSFCPLRASALGRLDALWPYKVACGLSVERSAIASEGDCGAIDNLTRVPSQKGSRLCLL